MGSSVSSPPKWGSTTRSSGPRLIDRVAQTRADLTLDLMWRFMDLAEPAINRVDDSNGELVPLFDPEAAEFDVCRMRKAGSELETRVRVRDHGVTITGE